MIDEKFQDVVRELRTILTGVPGFKNFAEDFTLSYVLLVDEGDSTLKDGKTVVNKDAARLVADTLVDQSAKNGINLEIMVLTEKEFDEAKEQMANAEATFKA